MKRRAQIEIGSVLAAAGEEPDLDDLDLRVLDATEACLRSAGLRQWSIDDVVERAQVGRTSVYRRFGDRDNLVHAVLARELRRTLYRMRAAVEAEADVESKPVAAVTAALCCLDDSVVESLLESDPDTFLPFLTTEAGPLLAVARAAITNHMALYVDEPSPELAEAGARLGLSFILTRSTILPVDDEEQLAHAVRRLVRPLLHSFGLPERRGTTPRMSPSEEPSRSAEATRQLSVDNRRRRR